MTTEEQTELAFAGYETLITWVKNTPMTMLPGLLAEVTQACEEKQCFREGKMPDFMAKAIEKVRAMPYLHRAYLVCVFDKATMAVKRSCIWSSPPWDQSMIPPDEVFGLMLAVPSPESYQKARDLMITVLKEAHIQQMFPAVIAAFEHPDELKS